MLGEEQQERIITHVAPRLDNALDLGCGDGRFAKRLAWTGVDVHAVDKEQKSFDHPNISFTQADLTEITLDDSYDLVLAAFVLHFLTTSQANQVIRLMKQHTRPQGYNALLCMNEGERQSPVNNDESAEPYFYPSMEDLNEIYDDWQVIEQRATQTPLKAHDGLPPHRHDITLFITQNA